MSVAGVLAGSMFSNAASLFGQKSPSGARGANSGLPSFAATQQKISPPSSGPTAGATSASGQLTQLGKDLSTGNLASAQADFSAFKLALSHGPASDVKHAGSGLNGQANAAIDPLAAAMQAYSSLQLSPMTNGLSTSLLSSGSLFTADA
jgi:hypothetical protein